MIIVYGLARPVKWAWNCSWTKNYQTCTCQNFHTGWERKKLKLTNKNTKIILCFPTLQTKFENCDMWQQTLRHLVTNWSKLSFQIQLLPNKSTISTHYERNNTDKYRRQNYKLNDKRANITYFWALTYLVVQNIRNGTTIFRDISPYFVLSFVRKVLWREVNGKLKAFEKQDHCWRPRNIEILAKRLQTLCKSSCKTRTLNDVFLVRLPAFKTERLVDSLAPEHERMSDW